MIDPRFFNKAIDSITLDEICKISGASLSGDNHDSKVAYTAIAPLDTARPSDISFFENKSYLDQFKASEAGACFVRASHVQHAPSSMVCLVSDNPYMAYAKTAQVLYAPVKDAGKISDRAIIDSSATIGTGVTIESGVVIKANVNIGENTLISANTVIEQGVEIGSNCRIGPLCVVTHALIGNGVSLAAGVKIGQPGFGFAMSPTGFESVPQLGRVIIEDDVDIGANTTIDRGSLNDTIVRKGTRIDNLVQFGHNVETGQMCVIVSQTGIAGSTKLGDFVLVGGQTGIAGHLSIGSGVKLAAQSGVMRDMPAAGEYMGAPAVPMRQYMRQIAMLNKMSEKKTTKT